MVDIHQSVMLEQALTALEIKADGVYVDCTFGRGGHSAAILAQLGDKGRLIALDTDVDAISYGKQTLSDPKLELVHDQFSNLLSVVKQRDLSGKIDGVLLDLGVSSPQLDNAERGFSFNKEGALDMRMNPSKGHSAQQWLAQASEKEIAEVLWLYGEERKSRQIAKAIIKKRARQAITTTSDLVACIKSVLPYSGKKHVATRSFQAIRIFINQELSELKKLLANTLEILKIGGLLVVISFHSLEDRIVKLFLRGQPAFVPAEIPLQTIAEKNCLRQVHKPLRPTSSEISQNRRARSAIMRVARRVC